MNDPAISGQGFLEWLISPSGQVAVAGAAGGMVKSITLRESWREGAASLTVGLICARYVSPLAQPAFEKFLPTSTNSETLAGFLVGVGGMAVVGFVLDVWQARRRAITGQGQ